MTSDVPTSDTTTAAARLITARAPNLCHLPCAAATVIDDCSIFIPIIIAPTNEASTIIIGTIWCFNPSTRLIDFTSDTTRSDSDAAAAEACSAGTFAFASNCVTPWPIAVLLTVAVTWAATEVIMLLIVAGLDSLSVYSIEAVFPESAASAENVDGIRMTIWSSRSFSFRSASSLSGIISSYLSPMRNPFFIGARRQAAERCRQ
nr:hypothetical protein [Cohnella thermotolerans]